MVQINFRLTAVWLVRSLGVCGWSLATVLASSQFMDSHALAFELEVELKGDCLNSAACVNAGTSTCGDYECRDTAKCVCMKDEKAQQCKCVDM